MFISTHQLTKAFKFGNYKEIHLNFHLSFNSPDSEIKHKVLHIVLEPPSLRSRSWRTLWEPPEVPQLWEFPGLCRLCHFSWICLKCDLFYTSSLWRIICRNSRCFSCAVKIRQKGYDRIPCRARFFPLHVLITEQSLFICHIFISSNTGKLATPLCLIIRRSVVCFTVTVCVSSTYRKQPTDRRTDGRTALFLMWTLHCWYYYKNKTTYSFRPGPWRGATTWTHTL